MSQADARPPRKEERKYGWELNHGLFEVHWKGAYADRVKICGTVFHYLGGKKVKTPTRRRR